MCHTSTYSRRMVIDEALLRQARETGARWADAQHQAELAKADYHHAVRLLHVAGASLREIADALDISHQRVHQIVEASGGATAWKTRRKAAGDLACTFCGSTKDEVTKLIAGPAVFICDVCVAAARQIIPDPQPVDTPRTHLDPVPGTSTLDCSFCGQSASVVDRLVAGPGVRICNGCLQICQEIITAQDS
jgi:hypothetical protein